MTKGKIVCPLVIFPLVIILFVLFSFFLWPLYCLFFGRFSFGHYIVCPFVIFPLAIIQRKNDKRTNNIMTKGKTTKEQTI
jgi:hypothetical protein